jgi:hypothetical protein
MTAYTKRFKPFDSYYIVWKPKTLCLKKKGTQIKWSPFKLHSINGISQILYQKLIIVNYSFISYAYF